MNLSQHFFNHVIMGMGLTTGSMLSFHLYLYICGNNEKDKNKELIKKQVKENEVQTHELCEFEEYKQFLEYQNVQQLEEYQKYQENHNDNRQFNDQQQFDDYIDDDFFWCRLFKKLLNFSHFDIL